MIAEKKFPVKDLETPKFICLNTEEKSWNDHKGAATDKKANLVSIMCKEQNEEVKSMKSGTTKWIGANDKQSEGTWKWSEDDSTFWSSGKTLLYSDWEDGQPNSNSNQDCGIIYKYKWHDWYCDKKYQAVYSSDEKIETMECKQYSSKIFVHFDSIFYEYIISLFIILSLF